MLKITFLNVSQGDSIVIEYEKNVESGEYEKICLIDSNIDKLPNNPTLNFLKNSSYREIEYIILSHPHYDHYSGLRQILEYCLSNNIIIKHFLHSCASIPQYLKSIPKSNISINELTLLFKTINNFQKNGLIKKISYVYDSHKKINLFRNIFVDFLSPSNIENDNFIRNVPLYKDEENGYENPNANWLSIVTRLSNSETGNFILFTSDVEKNCLKRIRNENNILKNPNETLKLTQCPHHGAKGNLYGFFWRQVNRAKNTPFVISVGQNKYNHPSNEVVKFARDNNYKVLSTNQVGSLINENIENDGLDIIIDLISIKTQTKENDIYNGDKVFEFDEKLHLITV